MTTLFIGQNHIQLKEVDSTNEFALMLVKSEAPPEGTIISALTQTNGKGQRGKQWLSEPGSNIILSIILKPIFLSIDSQFELNKAISVGLAGFVSQFITSKKVSIKWPNDIYVGENKIAGILIENNLRNNNILNSVIGIGFNVNQTCFDPLIPNPTSIKIETGLTHSTSDLIRDLCSFIEARYIHLRSGNFDSSNEAYNNLIYKLNEEISFRKNDGSIINGVLKMVDDKGRLVLQNQKEEKMFFSNSEGSILITKP